MSIKMKNPHDQTHKILFKNSTQSLRRVNAKANKANGSSSNLLLTHEKGGSSGGGVGVVVADNNYENNEETVQRCHGGDAAAGRERLKRHQEEVAGRVPIPETWGQEDLLKDWIDCSAFEALMVPNKIASARKALIADGRNRAASSSIESRC